MQKSHLTTRSNGLRHATIATALCSLGMLSTAALGSPHGGEVKAGSATIEQTGTTTQILQSSERAVIDWRSFGVLAGESVLFNQPSRSSATLNRVTGDQLSVILGRIDANGQVVLVNPNGIIFGAGAQINVGSLIASTANIANTNFMAGRLVFDEPGRPGAGVENGGTISVAEGGLVALVAPHVRNDGLIQARLGKVVLGAGDAFTLDLYGDGLINLAFAQDNINRMLDAQGKPIGSLVAQAGRIEADGAKVVLITAAAAKSVLDQVINLSGTIRADTVQQQGGHIVLLGRGGEVDVTGAISAKGKDQTQGQTGGSIDVLGDRVTLGSTAVLDASGLDGGGKIHVGGEFRGQGNTYKAETTVIDTGAQLRADAARSGDGGEVIVWADGRTSYAGSITARGGSTDGNGGKVEVSGKQSLDYLGTVDAGATHGTNGLLLLDPATLDVGPTEAGRISRTLGTGTNTTLAADVDINVNAAIDGRGGNAGGGLTLSAGNNINLNESIVTNNGAVSLLATGGTVNVGAGKGVFTGTAPINVQSGGDLSTATVITNGSVTFTSTHGNVFVDTAISGTTGAVTINAAADVNINQSVLNIRSGNALNVSAGNDVNVNAQIDGRDGIAGGSVSLSAARNVRLNQSVITANGAIGITTGQGTLTAAVDKGLFAGSGPINVATGAEYSTGILVTTGALNLRSNSGAVSIDTPISETTGAVSISAGAAVNINQPIVNIQTGANLSITAGTDIKVAAQIDGRNGVAAGGAVTMVAGNNIVINNNIVTRDGSIDLTATGGTVGIAEGRQIRAGSAPISVTTGADFSTGMAPPAIPDPGAGVLVTEQDRFDYVRNFLKQYVTMVTTGPLNIRSIAGNVNVDAPISDATGAVTLTAGNAINVNQKVNSNNSPIVLNAGSGGIVVNANSDACGSGGCTNAPEIDPKYADLTLNSVGNITIHDFGGVATPRTLTMDTRGQIVQGLVGVSQAIVPGTTTKKTKPDRIVLIADGGIANFNAGSAGEIDATSVNGSIDLGVEGPGKLRITTLSPTGNISTGGFIGDDVMLSAGGNVNLSTSFAGAVSLHAGSDVNIATVDVRSLVIEAGNNANLNTPAQTTWINDGGLSVTAGRDINATRPIHVPNSNVLTLAAGQNLTTGIIETLGPVHLSATTGNVTLNNDIGPHYAPTSTFNPMDRGVASLVLGAPAITLGNGNITMGGARAEGTISISAGGNLIPARDITSALGDGSITIISANANNISQLRPLPPVGNQLDVPRPPAVTPTIPPGPTVPPPAAPVSVGAAPPPLPEIAVDISLALPASATNTVISSTQAFVQAATLGESRTTETAQDVEETDSSIAPVDGIVVYTGGRGPAKTADLGRNGTIGSTADVFPVTKSGNEEERRKRQKSR